MLSSKPDKTSRKSNTTKHPSSHSICYHVGIFDPSSSFWDPGIVQCVVDTSCSYLVASRKGGVPVLRRSRGHLCRTRESYPVSKAEFPKDIAVADSSLQTANLSEHDAGSDTVSSEGAGWSSVEPQSVVEPN